MHENELDTKNILPFPQQASWAPTKRFRPDSFKQQFLDHEIQLQIPGPHTVSDGIYDTTVNRL